MGEVNWESLERETPSWFLDAKLGVFVHWGPYSVPAWAEPLGELGTIPGEIWFRHNPYAEWYMNTIRFGDSPAREHQREVYNDAPYDDFLDLWDASEFDPDEWADVFAGAGARYVVPTSKHHDGVPLWDAPGTGTRNTVRRGPRRDLLGEIEKAVRGRGLRFGVYYSGGLDWGVTDLPPIDSFEGVSGVRPNDAAYNLYAHVQVRDLIDRFRPDVLWNDINWPDSGKRDLPFGLVDLFRSYYRAVPDGLVNDRWGVGYYDFRTSEYQHAREAEASPVWEHNRGLGLSFGYNQVEDASHLLSGDVLVKYFVDIVSRGGNLLLNIGPTGSGKIADLQREQLEHLGAWLKRSGEAIYGTRPVEGGAAEASESPWARWSQKGRKVFAIVATADSRQVLVRAQAGALELSSGRMLDGTPVGASQHGESGEVLLQLPQGSRAAVEVVAFDRRS